MGRILALLRPTFGIRMVFVIWGMVRSKFAPLPDQNRRAIQGVAYVILPAKTDFKRTNIY